MAEPLDFDAWLDEDKVEPIKFKLLGQVWEIPGDLPAVVQLKLERIQVFVTTADPANPVLPEGMSLDDITYESLARDLLGDKMVDEWLRLGLGSKQMPRVTQRLMAIYRFGGDGLGKPPAQETRAKKKRKRKKSTRTPQLASQPVEPSSEPSSPTGE